MKENHINDRGLFIFATAMIILTGTIGGGYFEYVSSVLTILLLFVEIYFIFRFKKFQVACDINMAALLILIVSYLVTTIWAIDSGMAFLGFIKFLPVFLYFLLLCQMEEQRERIIALLPLLGSLMTIFSFVMMQFTAFKEYVTVAGRLAGFFQYPNTYALFLLVCLIVAVYQIDIKHPDWLCIGYILVLLFGIYMSGSRTAFLLTAATIMVLAMAKKEVRRFVLPGFLICLVLAVVITVVSGNQSGFARFTTMFTNSSTMLGRFLYDRDAVTLILRHPFGMGYYGYYFTQQEIQTGVYSVVNVHNELFQFMLDVGVIPAVLFYVSILKSVLSRKISARNRIVLIVMVLHSFVDYDFQFITMFMVLLLFVEMKNFKEVQVTVFTKTASVVFAVVLVGLNVVTGISQFSFSNGRYDKAVQFYDGNTRAKVFMLGQVESLEEMSRLADEIIEANEYVSVAYSARARAAYAKGDVEGFIKNKLKAIKLAPYQYEEYLDYLDSLLLSIVEYLKAEDVESAKVCLKRAEEVPEMLEEVKNRTSSLGWKIKDTPQVTLSHEYIKLLEEMKAKVYE